METVGSVKGTCTFMCPKTEMHMREREGLLHPFEILHTGQSLNVERKTRVRPKADYARMVKQFSRPAAGRSDTDPSQLRPAAVLRDTVTYLFESIVPKTHPAWTSVYEYVFDRLRAVRQDMVIQGIVGRDAIGILEQVVRFHLYASYRLRDADVADFDPVINKQHLLECLKRLLYLYEVSPGPHHHRVEFEGVYLLDSLGDQHALTHCLELNTEIRSSPLLRKCYEISQTFVLRNYRRCLRLISQLPCSMCLCAVNPHLPNLRINYLQILSSGYSVKNCKYPLEKLCSELTLPSTSAAEDLCSRCNLLDRFDHPDLGRSDDSGAGGFVCFNKSKFSRPKEEESPSCLAPLDAILSQESLSYLLLAQKSTSGRPGNCDQEPEKLGHSFQGGASSRFAHVELEQTVSRLGSVQLEDVQRVASNSEQTSKDMKIGSQGLSFSKVPQSNNVELPVQDVSCSSNKCVQEMSKSGTIGSHMKYVPNNISSREIPRSGSAGSQETPSPRGRGRGVRVELSGDNAPVVTPGRGRGRGRGRRKQ